MADNLGVTPGSGAIVKTDQGSVSGAHMQVVKLAVSGDGDESLIPASEDYGLAVDVKRLPSGAASEATLAGVKQNTDRIPPSPAQEHTSATDPHAVRLTDGTSFYRATTPNDVQPVSVSSLPLPQGAAQEHTSATDPHAVRLTDGTSFYRATTPNDVQPVSVSSLPLPQGAAQEHVTANSPHAVRLTDGTNFYDAAKASQLPPSLVNGRLDVNVGNVPTVQGTVTAQQGNPAAVANAWPIKVTDGSSTVGVSDVGGAKALKVDVVQSVGAASKVDKSSFVEGSSTLEAIGGVYNESPASDPAEDQVAAIRITAKRALHVNLRNSAGSELGTAANPLRVEPTGGTAQPVTGTVTANIGSAGPLLTEAAFQARINTLGQKTMANSTPVVVASDQSPISVSGTVTANQGAPNATPWNQNLARVGGSDVATAAAGVQKVGISDGSGQNFSPTNPLPVQLSNARTPVTQYVAATANQSNEAIWTPAGGKKFVIQSIIISVTGSGDLFIFDDSASPQNYILVAAVAAGGNPFQINFPNGRPSAGVNRVLRYTTGVGTACYITVFGYEE